MATFRTGFKILGEISKRQRLPRFRSFSEDRRVEPWKPEDQWAVRDPNTDICSEKPKKSRSWLNLFNPCKGPPPPPCDVRLQNCPPLPPEEPWYSLNFNFNKKKPKPPLRTCRMAMERERRASEECGGYTCDALGKRQWPADAHFEKRPDPVVTPCPKVEPLPPKEVDLSVFCGNPSSQRMTLAQRCQSTWMPYQEFRPPTATKPAKFTCPKKTPQPVCSAPIKNSCAARAPFSEYKQVDVPRHLYTRYKSVDLSDSNHLFTMTDPKCQEGHDGTGSLALQPPPLKSGLKKDPETKSIRKDDRPPYHPMNMCKPWRLLNAEKIEPFRPKQSKLIEKMKYKNPCAGMKCASTKLTAAVQPDPMTLFEERTRTPAATCSRVLTATLTDEPQMFERFVPSTKPPSWMYRISKPGTRETPLVPCTSDYPVEPDWCGETDGLKFFDGNDSEITPKPGKDPCRNVVNQPKEPVTQAPPPLPMPIPRIPVENFILMPDKYKIRNSRDGGGAGKTKSDQTFQEYLESKRESLQPCSNQTSCKESIFYDMQRGRCNPLTTPCCVPPPKNPHDASQYRTFSNYTALPKESKTSVTSIASRLKSSCCKDPKDSHKPTGPCKPGKILPKKRPCCPIEKTPHCAEMGLPCCQPAQIPPDCRQLRMPRLPCKKKAAPKPSFSECAKDPPPPGKLSECTCWETKDPCYQGPGKPRVYQNTGSSNGNGNGNGNGNPNSRCFSILAADRFVPPSTGKANNTARNTSSFQDLDILSQNDGLSLKRAKNKLSDSRLVSSSYSQVLKLSRSKASFSTTRIAPTEDYLKIRGIECSPGPGKCGGTNEKGRCNKPKPKCPDVRRDCTLEVDRGNMKTWVDCPCPPPDDPPPPCEIIEDTVLPGCKDDCDEPCNRDPPCKPDNKKKCMNRDITAQVPRRLIPSALLRTPSMHSPGQSKRAASNLAKDNDRSDEEPPKLEENNKPDDESVKVEVRVHEKPEVGSYYFKKSVAQNKSNKNDNEILSTSSRDEENIQEEQVRTKNLPSFIGLLGQKAKLPLNVSKSEPPLPGRCIVPERKGFFKLIGDWWLQNFGGRINLGRTQSDLSITPRKMHRFSRTKSVSASSLIHRIRLPNEGKTPPSLILAKHFEIRKAQPLPDEEPEAPYDEDETLVKASGSTSPAPACDRSPQPPRPTPNTKRESPEEQKEKQPSKRTKCPSEMYCAQNGKPDSNYAYDCDDDFEGIEEEPREPIKGKIDPEVEKANWRKRLSELERDIENDINVKISRSSPVAGSVVREPDLLDDFQIEYPPEAKEAKEAKEVKMAEENDGKVPVSEQCPCKAKDCPFRSDNWELAQVYPESLSSLLIYTTPTYANKLKKLPKFNMRPERFGKMPSIKHFKFQRTKEHPYAKRSYSTKITPYKMYPKSKYCQPFWCPHPDYPKGAREPDVSKKLKAINAVADGLSKRLMGIYCDRPLTLDSEDSNLKKQKKKWKPSWKLIDTSIRKDLQKCAEERKKKKEVWQMVNKLEVKRNLLQVADKVIQKQEFRQKKKNINEMVGNLEHIEKSKRGKYSWQHEMFKNPKRQYSCQETIKRNPAKVDPSVSGLQIRKEKQVSETVLPMNLPGNLDFIKSDREIRFGIPKSLTFIKAKEKKNKHEGCCNTLIDPCHKKDLTDKSSPDCRNSCHKDKRRSQRYGNVCENRKAERPPDEECMKKPGNKKPRSKCG